MKKLFSVLAVSLFLTGCVTTGSIKPVVNVPNPSVVQVQKELAQVKAQDAKEISSLKAEVQKQAGAKDGARVFMFVFFFLGLAAVYFPNAKFVVKIRSVIEKIVNFVVANKTQEMNVINHAVAFFKNLYAKLLAFGTKIFVKKA